MNKNLLALCVLALATCSTSSLSAQILTSEDSLANGLSSDANKNTVISGYGEAAYRKDFVGKTATANLTRGVIFLGHKFNSRITFFSEIEIEDAKVAGGESGGEVAFEQAFLKLGLTRNIYLTAGLFIPRIGITNENHLPTTYNTVARPRLETYLIPSTWRELGIGLYGTTNSIPGLNYSLAVMNGLNSSKFEAGNGIREGRYEGRDASANNLAITGALLYYIGDFRIQVSGYYGGTVAAQTTATDSAGLTAGTFGTPVILTEADVQYRKKGFYITVLGANISIPDAEKIHAAYANNTASLLNGFYAEAGYNLLEKTRFTDKKLMLFSRYEDFDLNRKIPSNGVQADELRQTYLFAGISYMPARGVIIKADYELMHTGTPAAFTPTTAMPGYTNNRGYLNLGIGYSF